MTSSRRAFLRLTAAALSAGPRFAWAQAYPSRPVRWVVGYTPGGGNDIIARLMGQWLQDRLGQPFVMSMDNLRRCDRNSAATVNTRDMPV